MINAVALHKPCKFRISQNRKRIINMKKSLSVLGTAVAFLFAFALSFNALISNAWALGDFSKTCEKVSIRDSTLSALCKNKNQDLQNSSLDLNIHIGNIDGQLQWGFQNFIATCVDTEVCDGRLIGNCLTRDQESVMTVINLNDHIANIDGRLQYE